MKLSDRLTAVVNQVSIGNKVADIGCDHAYTSIYLVENNITDRILATDINDGPLSIAKSNIISYGHENCIEVRKSDGLKSITESDEIDTILISGMGGHLVVSILESNTEVLNNSKELILQPQSDLHIVRHYLHDNGFMIVFEQMIYEEGKYYTVIKAVKGQEEYNSETEYLYGKYNIDNPSETFINYIKYLINENIKIRSHLEQCNNTANDRYKELIDSYEELKSVIR